MSSDDLAPEAKPEPIQPAAAEPIAQEALPPPPRFEVQPYVPDGNFPPMGLAMTLGGGLAAALFVGFVASFIGQWFYLVILFPFFIGLALGGIGTAFIKAGKLRNPLLAGIAAGLSGIMAMATMHYVDYQRSLDEMAKGITIEVGKGAEAITIDRSELAKHISFANYIDMMATQGVTISRAAHNDKGMNLGYIGSYIYWLVEMAVVAGVAWAIMRKTASAPFCVECNSWKNERALAMVTVPAENMAVQAIQEGDVVKLLSCAGPIKTEGLLLKAAACPHCGAEGEVDISLDRLAKNSKGHQETTTLTRTTYPGEVLRVIAGSGAE